MLQSLRHYFVSLTFLIACAAIYNATFTPWVRAPDVEAIRMSESPVLQSDDSLADVFSADAWQLGPCKQLQTAEGMLLFQNWEQTDDDQWKLWPVTIVIGRGMSAAKAESPVILDAVDGAEIKFTESLDVMSGGAPPIHRGRMIGQVHIYRQGSSDEDDQIDIRTSNVGIDSRKIWTTEAIEMKVGRARMVGRDLTIHVSVPNPSGGNVGQSSTLLDRMELIYLDQLVMPLESGGLWATLPDPAQGEPGEPGEPGDVTTNTPTNGSHAMISLACGGRVEYDFALDQLSLRESVSLIHHVPGKLTDRFDCDSLELTLNDPTNDSIARNAPMDWLSKIDASGDPVVAKLPSFDSELAAENISVDVRAGLLRARGSKGIQLRRGNVRARLASLVYQFDPKHPKAIGVIDAQGAGIVQIDDPALPIRKAQWRQGVKLQPVGSATADDFATDVELWVDGDLHAWMSDGGEFQADSIAGVLTPVDDANSSTGNRLVPDRFEVTGNVQIDTTAISAQTQKLLLFFVNNQDPQPELEQGESPTEASPLRQWVVQPRKPGEMVDPVARPRPVIRGDAIRAELNLRGSELSARKLSVIGSVEVVHHLKTDQRSLPARLTGEQLQLIDGGGEDILQLTSGPNSVARFELGDGFFSGPQIQVRPSDNLIWMNSAGEFQMPTAALPTGFSQSKPGTPGAKEMKWAKAPHCLWQGQMIFDGRTAVLSDGVEITAAIIRQEQQWDLHMTGDRLQVDLVQGVEVRDMQTIRNAMVQSVSLMESKDRPVVVQALCRALEGSLEARHMLHASKLVLSPDGGGRLVGEGPGWYRGWMLPSDDSGLTGQAASISTNPDDVLLTGIHLVFHDSMQADMAGRNLDFLRGVRAGVRNVASWEDIFDANTMDAISLGDSTLDCDRLRFNIEPGFDRRNRLAGTPTPWEMEAISGVVFRTRNDRGLLEGTAARAAYSSSKDLFTVEGAPNRAAIFRQTLPDGSPGPEGAVRTMSIRPGTMKVENAVIERLNIATPDQNITR